MNEHEFQRLVKLRLKGTLNLWHFTKEAASLRGLPDIVGLYKGRFFAWELKKSRSEANKNTGRIVLQRYILGQVRKAGGLAELVHPENFEEMYHNLLSLKNSPTDYSSFDNAED